MKDNYLIILLWIYILVWIVVIILSNQINTLNNNTELLINRTDTILTILQD